MQFTNEQWSLALWKVKTRTVGERYNKTQQIIYPRTGYILIPIDKSCEQYYLCSIIRENARDCLHPILEELEIISAADIREKIAAYQYESKKPSQVKKSECFTESEIRSNVPYLGQREGDPTLMEIFGDLL